MISTGKKARKQHGTRAAAKRAKRSKREGKDFGKLPVSESRGIAESWRRG